MMSGSIGTRLRKEDGLICSDLTASMQLSKYEEEASAHEADTGDTVQ